MPTNYKEQLARVTHGYHYRLIDGVGILEVPAFEQFAWLTHGFTSRVGGISKAPYDSLNLCWTRDESSENTEENFKIFCDAAGLNFEEMALVNHEHGTTVLAMDRTYRRRGFPKHPLEFCDGFVTDDPGITLVTSHADCSVFYFCDPIRRAIGICHAGWRGTLGRIGAKVVEKMRTTYGCNPKDIYAAVGPCICKNCFEVAAELGMKFREEFHDPDCAIAGKAGKMYVDLSLAAILQFLDAGVPAQNISAMDACTYEKKDLFFSYRRDRGETGSMIGYIKLI